MAVAKPLKNMIKLMITDDHPLVIDGIKLMMTDATDIKCVGEARNGKELLEQLKTVEADVLLLDINMPEMNGLETSKVLRQQYPDLKIIILSMLDEAGIIKMMFKYGVKGYLLKNAEKKEILKAIRTVYKGGKFYSTEITEIIMAGVTGEQTKKSKNPFPGLTRREKQILGFIVEEFTTGEIAEKLNISFNTVETHRKNLLIKLGARNTAGLVRTCLEYGLLED